MENRLRNRSIGGCSAIFDVLIWGFTLSTFLLFSVPPAFADVRPDVGGVGNASVTNITLITGDTIVAYNISGKMTYSILPDSTTGIARNYQIIRSPQGTYFIPDNVDLKKVDPELFNINYLLEEDYGNLSFIPTIMTFESIQNPTVSAGIGVMSKGKVVNTSKGIGIDSGKGINIVSVDEKIGVAAAYLDKKDTGSAFISLLGNNKITKIWLDKKRHITLNESVPLIGAPTLWAQGYNGSGVKIAILDTGIDAAHPDLDDIDDNSLTNDPKVLVQKNFVDWNVTDFSDNTINDLFGHGTHVASIASGTGEVSGGVYKGVAPGAFLWNIRVLNRYGWGFDSWIINGINYAAYGADGIHNSGDEADIISMSLGGPTDEDDPMSRAVNSAIDAGVVVTIAAGNSGCNFCISTPGAADKVITVGATDKSDNLARFSSRGPTLDYRVKPDVVAPGVNIVAARASGTSMGSPLNNYYTSASGTSMATPHVAGAAAILLQKGVPAGWNKPSYVKNVLISSAKDLNLNVYEQGGGRIQIPNASRGEIIPDPATVSFKIINSTNTSVITFYNLNTTSSKTLNLTAMAKDFSGNTVGVASLNTSSLTIASNSSASVLLTVNATNIPKSIYSGKLTAISDNGEKVSVIFGFSRLNELMINKIKFDGTYAQNENIWVYKTNVTNPNDYFSRFIMTDASGIAIIDAPDGEYNIWSGSFNRVSCWSVQDADCTWIWTTKDKLLVTSDISTTLDERLSLPVSFDPNKPNQKLAGLYSVLDYSGYSWTFLSSYPSNPTTRITPTSVSIAHSYEYYPGTYYSPFDPSRINTPEWNKLYFSDQGISSPKNYVADYSKLVSRSAVYKTALIKESAGRYEWAMNMSYYSCICWAWVWQMDLPQQRTEYITPDTYFWGGLSAQNWSLQDREYRNYSTGSTPTEVWNSQPFSWSHNINRGSNWLYIYGQAFTDTSKHYYYSWPVQSNFTLYRNGIEIYNVSTGGDFSYYNTSEPSIASYSAVIEGASNQNLSIRSRTVLNFSYTGSGDYKPPKIFMEIPKLDMYNRLLSNTAEINLFVIEEKEYGFVNGTPDQLSNLNLEYSINDGSTWNSATLNSLGNGEYNATILSLPNNTFVSLRAKAVDNSGNSASHELIKAFLGGYHFELPPAQFNDAYSDRGLDTDGNGFYDYLVIDVGVNVSKAGYYQVSGNLYNSSGWYIDGVSNNAYLDAGNQTVQLRFSGTRIWQSRTSGTFDLRYLGLYNTSDGSQLDYRYYAYTTESYNYSDFRPQAILVQGIKDYGQDTDNNGLYDYLVIEKQVNVTTAGNYELDGSLYNSSGYYIASAYNYTTLNAGVQNITLRFSGVQIYGSSSTGNFTVYTNLFGYLTSSLSAPLAFETIEKSFIGNSIPKIADIENSSSQNIKPLAIASQQSVGVNSWQWFDSATDLTGYYDYTQFERPPALFNNVYSDRGLDTDGNGFYDYLVIDVGVNVSKAGYYQVSGNLYNSSGWHIDGVGNNTYLDAGNQTVQLRFRGARIWQSHTSGTFDLRYLSLYNASDWSQLDYRYYAYTTKSYNYTDFRPQAVLIQGINDYGLDTDNNGLYDYLVIEKQVNVTAAGYYELDGSLYNSSGYYIASAYNYTTLNAGVQNITLRFSGAQIYRSNGTGNFTVITNLYGYSASSLSAPLGSVTIEKSFIENKSIPKLAEIVNSSSQDIKPLAIASQQSVGVNSWQWFDSATDVTGYYSYLQFDRPAAGFNDLYSDRALDTDSNGFYEYLAIDVGVNVSKAGYYQVSGSLYNSSGLYIDGQGNSTYLDAGNQIVQLRFSGARIWQSRTNGTFDLRYLGLYNASDGSQLDYRDYAYTTKSYNYTDFRPQAVLVQGIKDYGQDTDNNGLFDYLVVEKQVNIMTTGTYELDGYLSNSSGYYVASAYNSTTLNVGLQNITLRFSGVQVYRSNSTGSFTVNTNLYSTSSLSSPLGSETLEKSFLENSTPKIANIENSSSQNIKPLTISSKELVGVNIWQWLDSATDATGYYSYLQFERPAAGFNYVFSDRGIDADGDGLNENLAIGVGVNVSRAGYYQVSGNLYNSSGWYIDGQGNSTYLDAGNQMVQLRFSGARIWQSATNGTFDLRYLGLYNASDGSQLDYRYYAYTTKSYNYTDFQSPLPPLFVNITENPDPMNSGGTSQVTVHIITAGNTPVSGASVNISATGGTLDPTSGATDSNGDFKSNYTAPTVTTSTTYTISATASKTDYTDGSSSDQITVNPPQNISNVISIADVSASPASEQRVPIIIYNSTGVGSVGLRLSYNASVLQAYSDPILDKGDFTDFYSPDNSNNASGYILITAYKIAPNGIHLLALGGNPVAGYVRLRGVGTIRDSSSLNLSDITLTDDLGNDVPYAVRNGTFTIQDRTPPDVANPTASHEIPDDTDNEPLWGETALLNVTVTDESGVASVTVNLSEIGGSAVNTMTNMGGNLWSSTTNASAGITPKLYNLTVNATNIYGNSNTSVVIQLRVMKNGDCTGNGIVNIGDALRLANNVSHPGNPAYALSSPYVCEVTGNGVINIGDALRLANNVSFPGNPAYILK